jgi:mRNA interferase MazF
MELKRGDILYCELDGIKSEQSGVRPIVIVSNQLANIYSPVIIVCPLTTSVKAKQKKLPTHVVIYEDDMERVAGNIETSIVLCEQIRSISKHRILSKPIARLKEETLKIVEKSMLIAIGCTLYIFLGALGGFFFSVYTEKTGHIGCIIMRPIPNLFTYHKSLSLIYPQTNLGYFD